MKNTTLILILVSGLLVFSCKKDKEETTPFFPSELDAIKNELALSFDSLNNPMAAAVTLFAQQGIDTTAMRGKLLELFNHSSFATEFVYTTPQGIMQLIEPPAYYSYQGTDISAQAHVVKAFSTKQPVLSNAFPVVEGYIASVDIQPIVEIHQVLGAISAVIVPSEVLGRIITPVVNNQSFDIWVMEKSGMMLYDQDPAQVGINVFTDTLFTAFPQLITAAQKIAAGQTGETSYSFYQTGTTTVVTKKAYWNTYKPLR